MTLRIAATLLCAMLAHVGVARAVPLVATFGGPAGYGTNMLPWGDGSSAPIDLTSAFPGGLRFFGGPHMQTWVNENGNITFNGPVFTYTPVPFPIAAQPMIAAYWGDVDTRGGGAPARNGIYWHLEPGRMVVTWHNVGYYSIHDDRQMDFQMIVTNARDCRSGDFDVELRYNTCGWTTGDASGGTGGFGGTPAQAGFDAGNMMDFVELTGSRTMSIIDLCTTSNVSTPGLWRFAVGRPAATCAGSGVACDTGGVGACGAGATRCDGTTTVCSALAVATPERCDHVDNDCDGMVDDGTSLCPGSSRCVSGSCEASCASVTCTAGERCASGSCVGACDGVACPHGQQCVAGSCARICDVLTCGADELCVDGACVPPCPCRPCRADQTCQADGRCVSTGCEITTCDPGFFCAAGACRDACAGAVCPRGEMCETGACVPIVETPDAGAPDGGAPDAGSPDAGPIVAVDAARPMGLDAAAPRADAGIVTGSPGGSGGCGCSVPARRSAGIGFALAVGAFVLLVRRSRRVRARYTRR